MAQQMKDNTPPITFAQIDIKNERNLTDLYGTRESINLRLFLSQQNKVIKYKGENNDTELISWLQRVSLDISQEINEKEELKQLQKQNDVLLMYFGESETDKEYQAYEQIAYEFNELKFAHTFSSNLIDESHAKLHSVVLFKNFDNKKKQVLDPNQVTEQGLKVFIDKNSYPEVLSCNKRTAHKIYDEGNSALFLFNDDTEKGKEYEQIFRTVANKNKGKILFVILNIKDRLDSECFNETQKLFGIRDQEIPTVRILGQGQKYQFYKMEEDYNQKNIESLITKFRVKRLKPYIKSQPIPDEKEQQNRLIKVVVTDNYVKEVIDTQKDVVVVYTSPTCDMCQQYLNKFENITKLNPGSNLVFVTCDVEQNDIQHIINVQHVPTIKLYLAGKKKNPVNIALNSVFWAEEIAKLLSYKIILNENEKPNEPKKPDL